MQLMTTTCIVLKQERLAHHIKCSWKHNCNQCHKNTTKINLIIKSLSFISEVFHISVLLWCWSKQLTDLKTLFKVLFLIFVFRLSISTSLEDHCQSFSSPCFIYFSLSDIVWLLHCWAIMQAGPKHVRRPACSWSRLFERAWPSVIVSHTSRKRIYRRISRMYQFSLHMSQQIVLGLGWYHALITFYLSQAALAILTATHHSYGSLAWLSDFFSGPPLEVRPPNRFWRKMAQTTCIQARMILLQ